MSATKFVWATLLLGGLLAGCTHAAPAPQSLSADVTFRCLWWSASQMEGLDPNAPPPKETEVVIDAWEYSDPVGVPHPDVVDVVVVLVNQGPVPLTNLSAQVHGQWQTGPARSEAKARWGAPQPLKSWQTASLAPGESTEARVPVGIAARMSELEAGGAWPWRFRASLTVHAGDASRPMLHREIDLPIRPGD